MMRAEAGAHANHSVDVALVVATGQPPGLLLTLSESKHTGQWTGRNYQSVHNEVNREDETMSHQYCSNVLVDG